mgnify:CR=1 FL=1
MNKKGVSACVFSAKGGVGKTTNLLNLAGIISQLDKKVLIVDFDLYTGVVAKYLNRAFDRNIYNLTDDFSNKRYERLDHYTISYNDHISILSAPKDPRYANKIDIRYIKDIISMACLEYDVVLIDTNHALDACNLRILELVDEILFMTTGDPLDLSNMKSLITIFDSLKFDNYKIVLNNSRDPYKTYLGSFELKKILGHHIDYELSSDMFLKDMDRFVMEGKIMSLDTAFPNVMTNDYQVFVAMAMDLLGVNRDE